MCHKQSFSSMAGLQISVVKLNEILNKYGVNDLENEDKIFFAGVIEEIIYSLYKFIGNQTKVSNAKRIKYEHLISIINTTKSTIFSQALEALDEIESCNKKIIPMHDYTYKVMKQSHPDLSTQAINSTYMDFLIDIYCEKLAQHNLDDLEEAVENIFGNDDALCYDAIQAGKVASNNYKRGKVN